jgi:diguanylate cyclase (GGDEF)-like protein
VRDKIPPNRDLQSSIDAYAAWVERLRAGKAAPAPPLDETNPLARLGQQLKLLEETLQQREERSKQLFDLVVNVQQGLTIRDVLNRIFDGFSGLIPYDRIDCALLSDDGRELTTYWIRSDRATQGSATYSQPMAGSDLEQILRTNQPHIINDLEEYLKLNQKSDATKRIVSAGGRANLICPLVAGHRPIGFLFFTSNEKDAYKDIHKAIFQRIANQVSIVIHKSRIYQQIVDHNRELTTESYKLERAATHDFLTGIWNRGAIIEALDRTLAEYQHSGKPTGVIMADVDLFKNVNDTLGHPAGDAVLVEITRRIAASLREDDQIGRYGGEEFLVIAPRATHESARIVAERLRYAVAATPFILGTRKRRITASFGVAIAATPDDTAASLIAAADQALYAAKKAGRNRVVVAGSALTV